MGFEVSEKKYNEVGVRGTEWTDKVCLGENHCVSDFEFFMIESQNFLKEPVDGFLGLARS